MDKLPAKIILGIDPGTQTMGYGVLKMQGNHMEMLELGIVTLTHLDNQPLKLQRIFERTLALIDVHTPDELAIEAPFFAKNVQSMLKLGRAQGVAMAAGLYREIPITEYLPKKVKQAITGNGNATKEQVAAMLQHLVKLPEIPRKLDATDALAVAVCHAIQLKSGLPKPATSARKSKPKSTWDKFIAENPNRIA